MSEFPLHFLFNKQQATVCIYTESCWEVQEPFPLSEYLYVIYIYLLIVNLLFNNPEKDYDDILIVEIIY